MLGLMLPYAWPYAWPYAGHMPGHVLATWRQYAWPYAGHKLGHVLVICLAMCWQCSCPYAWPCAGNILGHMLCHTLSKQALKIIRIWHGVLESMKEVVWLALLEWSHASHGTRIKNERHKPFKRRYSSNFGEVSIL